MSFTVMRDFFIGWWYILIRREDTFDRQRDLSYHGVDHLRQTALSYNIQNCSVQPIRCAIMKLLSAILISLLSVIQDSAES